MRTGLREEKQNKFNQNNGESLKNKKNVKPVVVVTECLIALMPLVDVCRIIAVVPFCAPKTRQDYRIHEDWWRYEPSFVCLLSEPLLIIMLRNMLHATIQTFCD